MLRLRCLKILLRLLFMLEYCLGIVGVCFVDLLSTAARAGIVEVCFVLAQPEVEGGRRTPRHPTTATGGRRLGCKSSQFLLGF